MEEKNVFDVSACAKDVMNVLGKYNATFSNMKEVFKVVKRDAFLKTSIHVDDSASCSQ